MRILGIELEPLTLISIALTVCTIFVWILREWSWYSYQYKTQATITGLQESNDNLFLRLQIEEAAQLQCIANSTDEFGSGNNGTTRAFATNISTELIYPDPAFFDLSGFLQLCIFCGVILLEYYFLHSPHLNLAGDNPTEQGIKRELQEFLLKKHPVTNILIFTTIAFLSILAWWNLLPRTTFLDITFKVVLAVAVSSPIAYIVHNLLRVQQYFPKEAEDWHKAVRDPSWWLWLASRLVGAYDLKTASKTAIWLFCVVWYVWPIRYFFYYRFISCGVSDPLAARCADGVNGAAAFCGAVDATFASNNVFYVNMLAHGAILMVCCNVAYLMTMLKALNVTHKGNKEAGKKTKDSTYTTGMGIDPTQYGIIGAILRTLDNPNAVSLLALFSLCNSVLAILRVLWFCVFSTCTWYAVLVACMFIHTHVGVTMYALPSINALMQKYTTIDTYKDVFVEQFVEHQRDIDRHSGHPKSYSGSPEEKDDDFAAQEIFNKVLTDSVLFYLFVTTKSESKDASGESGKEGASSDSKLSVIFQAFLQTAAFAYQNAPTDDHADGDEGDEGDERDREEGSDAAAEQQREEGQKHGVNAELD